MSNTNPPNQFNSERASEAGKKSKRKPMSEQLKERAQELTKDGITYEEAMDKALLEKAAKGDLKAIEMYKDRAYGKPKQYIDQTTREAPSLLLTDDDNTSSTNS